MTLLYRTVLVFLAVIALTCSLSAPALAQSTRVTAGDHEGFTRIVVQASAIGAWTIGRTAEGYGLRLEGRPRYDLTGVFRLIGRNRLGAIWQDPEDGLLRLRVVCACHATAFLEGSGILVIDLRDGAAPEDSRFEAALQPGQVPDLQSVRPTRPIPRPAKLSVMGPVWAEAVRTASRLALRAPFPEPPSMLGERPDAGGALRTALTVELARGAARGVVDFARPGRRRPSKDADLPPGVGSRLAIHPGVTSVLAPDSPLPLTATGATCMPDEHFAIAGWGDDRPVWQQMAETTAIPGEFDATDADTRDRAVRRLLYLGFGLEARRLIEAFPVDTAARPEEATYLAMAQILDGNEASPEVFRDAAACDGAVALWAVLAQPPSPEASRVNTPAVRRAFSALPPHLRRLLGPGLVDRLLAIDDEATARDVQAATERPGGMIPPEVATSAAGIAMRTEDPRAALAALAQAPTTGPGAVEALVAQVEALVALGQPVAPDTASSLAALQAEYRGSPIETELRRALVLSRAASGDFDAAMAMLPEAPEVADTVFALLARAEDDVLLTHAAEAVSDPEMDVTPSTRAAVAQRLVDLGLGLPALDWLGNSPKEATLASRAALLAGDARAALTSLAGETGEAATALRRSAMVQLHRPGSGHSGDWGDAEPDLAIWSGEWTWVASHGPEPWKSVAELAVGPEGSGPAGTLAQANALLERAASTRTAVSALLAAVAPPD